MNVGALSLFSLLLDPYLREGEEGRGKARVMTVRLILSPQFRTRKSTLLSVYSMCYGCRVLIRVGMLPVLYAAETDPRMIAPRQMDWPTG